MNHDSSTEPRSTTKPPNVVLIVLDDVGFAELGCYGSDIVTPHVDRLAARGVRYNNFHVTALCAPTRASILTGRNHHAVGMGFLPGLPMDYPGYDARIPRSAATLPRVLRDSGYSTFAVGKWHLTPPGEEGPTGPFLRWPLGQGFDRFYGFLGGFTDQWAPELVRDNGFVEPPRAPEEGYHLTEDLTDQAVSMLRDQQNAAPDKPFFLYFSTGAAHTPHQAPGEWIEAYRGRFDHGWDAARERAAARQQQQGVTPPATTLTERPPRVPAWEDLTPAERSVYARQMETYAGFVSHTDAQIGRLVEVLSDLDVLDDTIVMVLSDNGAAGGLPQGQLGPGTRDVAAMHGRLDEFGGDRSHCAYASGWAWAGNAPFRLWKSYTWLGGVRVPLVIHWPAGISSEHHDGVRSQFCHAVDLMPTVLDAAGVEHPEVVGGATQQRLDGASLVDTFNDPDRPAPRDTQYFEMMGSRAIYHAGWKATTDHVAERDQGALDGSRDFDTDRWFLFNLAEDFSEAHDLATSRPEHVRRLVDLWWHEAGRNQVLPITDAWLRNSSYNPPPEGRYVYLPDSGPALPPSLANGFDLAAHIDVVDADTAGIVCAQGDRHGGWAIYARDGRVVVAVNNADVSSDALLEFGSRQPLTPGSHVIAVGYSPPGENGRGSIDVSVDGDRLTPRHPAASTSFTWPSCMAKRLRIGHDSGFPVCDDYQPPFPFTARIRHLTVDVLPSSGQAPSGARQPVPAGSTRPPEDVER